jgi:protein-S-isoprenylcysteine O-methyltransferase Ste14
LTWGATFCFYFIPVLILLNWQQALFEEKYILKKEFGEEFSDYRKKVGMFLPKWRKKI